MSGTDRGSTSNIAIERDVPATMRDGVVLVADLYRPVGDEPLPALLQRTPYGKARGERDALDLAQHGYSVLVQDVRGRHGSGGEFKRGPATTSDQIADGFDSVEWAAAQPFCDGRVGMWGASYGAWTGWQAAAAQPPSLGGIVVASFPRRSLDVSRGILDIGRRLDWFYAVAANARMRAGETGGPLTMDEASLTWVEIERLKWLWFLPLGEIPQHVFSTLTNDFQAYLRTTHIEQYNIDALHAKVAVPVLVIEGWWDRMVSGVENYTALRAQGPGTLARQHRLVVGPWGHSTRGYRETEFGDVSFPVHASRSFTTMIADWYDNLFCSGAEHVDESEPVEIFVLGRNEWKRQATWPPQQAESRELFLHSNGGANTTRGDGALTQRRPESEPADTYDFDPRDPVMSLMALESHLEPRDQTPNDFRKDKLVYQTQELDKPLEVVGVPEVVLWASSSAVDTDWVMRLIDVAPDGRAIGLSHGAIRARYRHGYGHGELLAPGEAEEYLIRLTPIAVVFLPGHRIRLDVCSSDFPNVDRNHNTGTEYYLDPDLITASQTILHDREHPSRILLPVIE